MGELKRAQTYLAIAALLLLVGCGVIAIPLETREEAPCAGIYVGVLTLTYEQGQLLLRDDVGRAYEVSWPANFSARHQEDTQVLLGPEGTVVAEAGDKLDIGGGFSSDRQKIGVCEIDGRVFP